MKLRTTYLMLAAIGAILPLTPFIPWVIDHGLNVRLLLSELFSTRIGAFFGLDVIVSALVLFFFIGSEGKRLKMNHLWVPVLATLSIGVSVGLPLFLSMRQTSIDSAQAIE